MRQEKVPRVPGGSRGYPIWSITRIFPETGGQLQTLHSGASKREAVKKAFAYEPPGTPPTIRRAYIAHYYKGDPNDLVI